MIGPAGRAWANHSADWARNHYHGCDSQSASVAATERWAFLASAMLCDYFHTLVHDRALAESVADVLTYADMPLGTITMGVRLYKQVLTASSSHFKRCKERCISQWASKHQSRVGADNAAFLYCDIAARREILGNTFLLIVTCCIIAHKYQMDFPCTNANWGQLMGLDYRLINRAELEILDALEYNLRFAETHHAAEKIGHFLKNDPDYPHPGRKKSFCRKQKKMLRKIFCM